VCSQLSLRLHGQHSFRPPDLHIDQIAGRETHPQAVRGVGKFLFD
jgi:hypothetical protein